MFYKRVLSIFLDIIFTWMIGVVVMSLLFIINFFINRYTGIKVPDILFSILFLIIYMNKDFVKSKSLGKRIVGLKIVSNKTGIIPSKFKLFIRNLTFFIFPVEILSLIFSPNKRLGDRIIGVKVIIDKSDKHPIRTFFSELKEEIKVK